MFIVLAEWHNSFWVDMSFHPDTFSGFQSLFLLFNAPCLAVKPQIWVLWSLVSPYRGWNSRSTTFRDAYVNRYIGHIADVVEIQKKITKLSHGIDKLYYIKLYQVHLAMDWNWTNITLTIRVFTVVACSNGVLITSFRKRYVIVLILYGVWNVISQI